MRVEIRNESIIGNTVACITIRADDDTPIACFTVGSISEAAPEGGRHTIIKFMEVIDQCDKYSAGRKERCREYGVNALHTTRVRCSLYASHAGKCNFESVPMNTECCFCINLGRTCAACS